MVDCSDSVPKDPEILVKTISLSLFRFSRELHCRSFAFLHRRWTLINLTTIDPPTIVSYFNNACYSRDLATLES